MKQISTSDETKTSYLSKFGLCILFFLSVCFSSPAQSYDKLNPLKGHQSRTYYSNGASERAKVMANRFDKVLEYYKKLINFEPQVTLLILSPQDWDNYTNFPVYGMPHYSDNNTLIVASENNDMWRSFIPSTGQLPEELAGLITDTYSDKSGDLTMQPFFDLLAIHELGHAYHIQGGLTMQRKWMGELFANLLLHTYIAENEPELLPALTVFPKMVVSSIDKTQLKFTTLTELEAQYDEIAKKHPKNYGWYQSRWHIAAGNIYNEGGLDAFVKLWSTLKEQSKQLDDSSFIALLSDQVHQSVAVVPLRWNEYNIGKSRH